MVCGLDSISFDSHLLGTQQKQTDFQDLSHQKFTLYIYEKVLTCKNFICRKTPSLLCVIKNPAT